MPGPGFGKNGVDPSVAGELGRANRAENLELVRTLLEVEDGKRRLSFVAFCNELDVEFEPAQLTVAEVAIDGTPPTHPELAAQLFGTRTAEVPARARGVIVAVCGRGSGKTYLFAALYCLWRALTANLKSLADGERAAAIIVCPDIKLARQCLRFVRGKIESWSIFKRMQVGEYNVDAIELQRPDKRVASIEAIAASRGGSSVRGRSLLCAVLDECAFFRDEEYVVNDQDIFDAVEPRILPGGAIVVPSTPWSETGLLYNLFTENYGHPRTAVAFRAPTLLMRSNRADLVEAYERARERDAVKASREWDANFISIGTAQFFDGRAIKISIDSKLTLGPVKDRAWPIITAGGDLGFRKDSSACVVVARNPSSYRLIGRLELRPTDKPLSPTRVVKAFGDFLEPFGVTEVALDQHYFDLVQEGLGERGIQCVLVPGGQIGKAEVYQSARGVIHEEQFRMPPDERLERQLRETISKPNPGGSVTIDNPRWKSGGHGDIVSALMNAIWLASRSDLPVEPARDELYPDVERAARIKRRVAIMEERAAADDEFGMADNYQWRW